jgi:methylase of polypeptide subunit release factors
MSLLGCESMLARQVNPEFVQFYQDFQSSKPTEDILVEGLKLLVFRDVYSPDPSVTYASQIMLNHIKDLEGKRVLDLGTGCGLLAIKAALAGADSVTAVDINHLSVVNALENIQRFELAAKIEVMEGDLFTALEPQQTPYDLIVAHLPVLEDEIYLTHSLINLYYDLTLNAPYFLADNGKMLVSYPAFGDSKSLYFLQRHPLISRRICESRFGVDWFLFEFKVPSAYRLKQAAL